MGSSSCSAASKGWVARGSSTSSSASAAARRLKLVSCLSSVTRALTAAWPAKAAACACPRATSNRACSSLVEGFQPRLRSAAGSGAPDAGMGIFQQARKVREGPGIAHASQGRRRRLTHLAARVVQGGRPGPSTDWSSLDLPKSFDRSAAHLGILVAQAREQQFERARVPAASRLSRAFRRTSGLFDFSRNVFHQTISAILALFSDSLNRTECLDSVHRCLPVPDRAAMSVELPRCCRQ